MKIILSLATKDLRLLSRDKMGLIWMLMFPLFLALFFGSVFGSPKGNKGSLQVAVVDQDQSKLSRRYLAKLKAIEVLKLTPMSLAQARDAVRRSKQTAYLRIPQGFGKKGFFGGGGKAGLEVGVDPARRATVGYLEGLLTQGYFQTMVTQFTDLDQMKAMLRQGKQSIQKDKDLSVSQRLIFLTLMNAVDAFASTVDPKVYRSNKGPFAMKVLSFKPVTREGKRPLSAYEISFPSGLLWGLLSVALGFALSMVKENHTGTFLRLQMAPISRAQILLGKGMACFLTALVVMALILTVGVVFTKVRIESPALLGLALLCNAACFVGIMMFTAVLGRTEEVINGVGWATMMVMAMLGGGMIPLFAMPSWLANLSHISPVKWGILAIEGAIWRDFSLATMLFPCSVLVGVGLVFFGIGWWIFSRRG